MSALLVGGSPSRIVCSMSAWRSQAIDIPALDDDGRIVLDPTLAQTEALSVVDAEPGVRGSATASTNSVSVTVRRRVPTMLLGLAGLRTLTVSADATAAPQQP